MSQKRKPDQTKRIIAAALACADKSGWADTSLNDIAKKAKIRVSSVEAIFPDISDIIRHTLKTLDNEMTALVTDNLTGAWRDDLFEILMSRFEIMDEHKNAYVSLLPAILHLPTAAPRMIRRYGHSMKLMLETAGLQTSPAHMLIFGGLYASIADTWRKDDTPDLSKTMAAVDKRLDFLARIMDSIPSCRRT
ncbi:MAG: TetR/AcrR family transcriptional regulator [Alphaproteobacteria bacterium]|nr:TetR/AcrR family transcriptional regulator [Alphaproteobacteria bacterium]